MSFSARNCRTDTSAGAAITSDTLLLASSLHVPHGSLVIEMGCGSCGAIHAAWERNPGCTWIGFDINHEYLLESRRSACGYGGPEDVLVVRSDAGSPPFRHGVADAVICNPPFSSTGDGRSSPDQVRERSRRAAPLLLHRFVRTGAFLLRKGGRLTIINRPRMLGEMLLGCRASGIAPETIQPVGMTDRPAVHVILSGLKGTGASLEMLPQRTKESLLDDTEGRFSHPPQD